MSAVVIALVVIVVILLYITLAANVHIFPFGTPSHPNVPAALHWLDFTHKYGSGE